MAQEMTLSVYLQQRGKKAKALTRGEAELLGIPFPLQAGWPRRYSSVVIDDRMFERLMAFADARYKISGERARNARANDIVKLGAVPQRAQAGRAQAAPKVIFGFVVRKARRYCPHRPAPWT